METLIWTLKGQCGTIDTYLRLQSAQMGSLKKWCLATILAYIFPTFPSKTLPLFLRKISICFLSFRCRCKFYVFDSVTSFIFMSDQGFSLCKRWIFFQRFIILKLILWKFIFILFCTKKKNQYTSWAKLHLGLQRIYFFPLHRKFRIFNFPACCDLYDIRVHKSI